MAQQVDNFVSDGSGVVTLTKTPSDATQVRIWASELRQKVTLQYNLAGVTVTFVAGYIPPIGDAILADYPF